MSSKWKLIVAVVFLCSLGGGVAWYKTARLGVPFWQGEQAYDWQIEARVSFLATGKSVKARLSLPSAAIEQKAGQESGSLGYHYNIDTNLGEYTAVWSAENREENQALYYRVRLPESTRSGGEPKPAEAPEPGNPGLPGTVGEAANTIVARAKAITSDPDSLFVSLFQQIHDGGSSQELVLLKRHYEREYQGNALIQMGIDLLEMSGVPARLAYGVRLDEESARQPPMRLVEYCDGAYWKVRDPMNPGAVLDGREVFVWHRGGGPLLDVTGGESSQVVFTVARDRIPMASLTDLQNSPLLVSTILGLPLSERDVFRYIVLIPLGAFVVVLMRNIVGVSTLGTFMPVLLALALLEIPLGRALVMFSVLIAAGLWFRFLLSRLNLLVVPRVAACVVIVTLLMMVMSVLSYRMGMGGAVQITLFPMIIIAWTIERMSLIWEEEGKRSALVQVSGSVLVAVLAYLFMKIGQVRYWAFYFPELLLVLLAGILLIGRYTGYRLSELVRFKTFPSP
jgi:7 transmembrane helices usually fused to an inactive transglutaminase/Inactive transglutaminase fused to 7 transmembrane helices